MKLFGLIIIFFLAIGSCRAESEVVVQDTAGNVRAQSTLDENGQVEVELTDSSGAPLDGVEVTLTNTLTGEIITDVSAAGLVVFANVTPGVWVVAASNTAAIISTVSVGSLAAVGAAGVAGATAGGIGIGSVGTGAVAAAAVAGGSVAIANSSDNNNSDTPPLSPFQ